MAHRIVPPNLFLFYLQSTSSYLKRFLGVSIDFEDIISVGKQLNLMRFAPRTLKLEAVLINRNKSRKKVDAVV